MSLFGSLFGGLFGEDESKEETIEYPCSNCPSSCALAPDACSVCQPYKEKMIDAIYRVEHKDEIISQYEVVGTSAQTGTVICPHCGGHSENHYICDYCGSSLQEGSGKIKVASAAEIPNPVLEAQDLIFERQAAVREFTESVSSSESGGFLSSIFGSLFDMDATEDTVSIGRKMTEGEINEMADYFHVSVSEYLTGLDNGKYPTLSNKESYAKTQESYTSIGSSTSGSSSGMLSGLAGLAGALGLGSAILGGTQSVNNGSYHSPASIGGLGGMNLFGLGSSGSVSNVRPGTQNVHTSAGNSVNYQNGLNMHPSLMGKPGNPANGHQNPKPQQHAQHQTAQDVRPQNVKPAQPKPSAQQYIKPGTSSAASQKPPVQATPKPAAKPAAKPKTEEKKKPGQAEQMAANMAHAGHHAAAPKKNDGNKLGSGSPKNGNRGPGGRH